MQPVDPSLFTSVEPIRLAGSRCTVCGSTTFPEQADCPRCARRTMERVQLPDDGTLWTWTVQSFEPKPPYVAPGDGFESFVVGYIDLDDVIVEARLVAEPAELRIGMRMRLVPLALCVADGQSALGYAFTPAAGCPS